MTCTKSISGVSLESSSTRAWVTKHFSASILPAALSRGPCLPLPYRGGRSGTLRDTGTTPKSWTSIVGVRGIGTHRCQPLCVVRKRPCAIALYKSKSGAAAHRVRGQFFFSGCADNFFSPLVKVGRARNSMASDTPCINLCTPSSTHSDGADDDADLVLEENTESFLTSSRKRPLSTTSSSSSVWGWHM